MKIREFIIKLGVKADNRRIKQFDGQLGKLGRRAGSVVGALGRLAASFLAVNAAARFGREMDKQAHHTDQVIRLADALGVQRDAFQEVNSVMEQMGGNVTDTSDLYATIADRFLDARDGVKSYQDDLKLLGITMRDIKSVENDTKGMLDMVIERAQAIESDTARAAAAVRLFGDDVGRKILPGLKAGATSFQTLRKAARDAGQVLNDDQIMVQRRLHAQITDLRLALRGLKKTMTTEVAPVVGEYIYKARNWVLANRAVISSRLGDFLEAVGRRLKMMISFVGRGIDIVKNFVRENERLVKVLAAIAGGIALFASPIGLLVSLYLVLEDLFGFFEGKDSLIGRFAAKFPQIGEAAERVWKALETFKEELQEVFDLFSIGEEESEHLEDGWTRFAVNAIELVLVGLSKFIVISGRVIWFMGHMVNAFHYGVEVGTELYNAIATLINVFGYVTYVLRAPTAALGYFVSLIVQLIGYLTELAGFTKAGDTISSIGESMTAAADKALSWQLLDYADDPESLEERGDRLHAERGEEDAINRRFYGDKYAQTSHGFGDSYGAVMAWRARQGAGGPGAGAAAASAGGGGTTNMHIERMEVVSPDPVRAGEYVARSLEEELSHARQF